MTRRQCIPARLDQYVNHDPRLIFKARLVFKAWPLLAQLRETPGLYSRPSLYLRPGFYSRKYGIRKWRWPASNDVTVEGNRGPLWTSCVHIRLIEGNFCHPVTAPGFSLFLMLVHDVDRVYDHRPRPLSASFNHYTIKLLAKILHINTRYDFMLLY